MQYNTLMPDEFKIIKPLIIGLGVAGKRHLDAQLNLGFQAGVYTQNSETAQTLKNQAKVIIFDNLEEAINWSNLVHVCTPDDQHTEYVALAIKNNKAVLCEKSFTTSLKDALYLQKLAHQNNATIIVGQNYRLTPTFTETKKLLTSSGLGALKTIKTTYFHDVNEYQQRKPLRKNEDFLYIAGSHAIDLACWIANEPVVKLKAQIIKQETKNYPASYHIELAFVSGLFAQVELDATTSRNKSGTDLIVECERGELRSHNKSNLLLFHQQSNKTPQVIDLANNQTLTTAIEVKVVDDYLSGKNLSFKPLPGIDEAVNIIKVLDAISKAASSGKEELLS